VRFRCGREQAAWIGPQRPAGGTPACERWFEGPNPKRLFCSDRCRLQAFSEHRRVVEDVVQ